MASRSSCRVGCCLARALAKCDIPYAQSNHRGKRELFAHGDTVKLVTMHSSKGLEFPLVIIPDLGALPGSGQNENDEALETRVRVHFPALVIIPDLGALPGSGQNENDEALETRVRVHFPVRSEVSECLVGSGDEEFGPSGVFFR